MKRAVLFSCAALACTAALPAGADERPHRMHVIAVGVAESQTREFSSTVNSAMTFVETLQAFNGVSANRNCPIHLLVSNAVGLTARQPTAENIRAVVDEALSDVKDGDEVLFYFCGHGLTLESGSYLIPANVVPRAGQIDDPEDRLVPLAWIRDRLLNTPASLRVVILDCCHSGDIPPLAPGTGMAGPPGDIGGVFRDAPVVVLTSCGRSQYSLLWPQKNMALFSYFVCQGLKGAADGNRNGAVSMDELFEFSRSMVEASLPGVRAEICRRANLPLSKAPADLFRQVPQRFLSLPDLGATECFHLSPLNFHQSMKVLTELTHDMIQLQTPASTAAGPPVVAVGEFVEIRGESEELRGPHGCLGKLAADRLTQQLIQVEGRRYLVMMPDEVANHLLDVGIRARHDPQSWKRSASDFFVDTSFVHEKGDQRVRLSSSLIDCSTGAALSTITSFIHVNRELEAVLGNHGTFVLGRGDGLDGLDAEPVVSAPRPARPPSPAHSPSDTHSKSPQASVKVRVQKGHRDEQGHLRYRDVTFAPVGTEGAQGFTVAKGDELRLLIGNTTDDKLAFVVMMDGVNVLDQVPGITPEEALQRFLYFTLDAQETAGIDGWLLRQQPRRDADAQTFQHLSFKVVNASDSVAGQKKYGQDFGEIRVVVYKTTTRSTLGRGPLAGIGAGTQSTQVLNLDGQYVADPRQGFEVFVYRYFTATAL